MTYKSDKNLTFDILVINAFTAIVIEGVDESHHDIRQMAIALLQQETEALITKYTKQRYDKLERRANRALTDILEPFIEAEASVGKFGLVFYYCLRQLIDQGQYAIVDGSPLDKFTELLLSDEGTLVEMANVDKLDASAQKQARKVLDKLVRVL